jgi:hypothetical protein
MVKGIKYITALFVFALPGLINLQAQKPSLYEVTRMPFSSSLFNDIAPVIVKDGIVFCSDRKTSSISDATTFEGNQLYNIFFTQKIDTSEWTKVEKYGNSSVSLFNEGPLCFTPDGKSIYFTRDIETGKKARKKNFVNKLGIFIADISGENWTNIRQFQFNNPQYNVAHPSISSDGKYLFFASDMPGGNGGSDLYYCELINGQWGNPVNLGNKVNSSASEIYPFIHPAGKLYFSSSRNGGLGGMDIYFTSLSYGQWETPVLMPEPINSSYDDFALVAETNEGKGYFSSDRKGRNDDIYSFSSTIIRRLACDTLQINNYCYEFYEENAVKFDTIPFRYEWNFGDGNKAIGARAEHCYSGPGDYKVSLDVINLITKEIQYNEVTYDLPVRDIEQPYINCSDTAFVGEELKIDANSTYLPGWSITRYYWNFGDETISIDKETQKIFTKSGIFNIQLMVSTDPDAGGVVRESCISKNIVIIKQP